MKKNIGWLGAAWVISIAIIYYKYHPRYLETIFSSETQYGLLTALIIVILYGCFVGYYTWYKNEKILSIHRLNVLSLGAIGFIFTFLICSITLTVRGLPSTIPWGTLEVHLFLKLLGLVLALALLVWIAAATGHKVLRICSFAFSSSLDRFIVSVATGLTTISLLTFILAALGRLNMYSALGMCIVLLVFALPEAIDFLRDSWRYTPHLSWKPWSLDAVLVITMLIIVSLNLMHIIRPIPNGWDEFALYLNTPRTLALSSGLISGVNAYPFELVMSIGLVLFNSLAVTLGIATMMGMLSMTALFAIARKYVSRTYSLLAAVLFYSMPFVIFQSSREVKIDLATTFFCMSSFIAVMQWKETEKRRWLALAGLFAGFAFTIKYTSLFFILGIGIALLLALISKKRGLAYTISGISIFGALCVVPYIPWASYFIHTAHTVTFDVLQRGDKGGPQATCIAPLESSESTTEQIGSEVLPQDTGSTEELGRYLGYTSGVMRYVSIPWTATMNPVVRGLHVDMGFIFLALFPPLLLFVPWRKRESKWVLMATFSISYWVLWSLLAQGVIWYGLPGFMGLLVVLVGMLTSGTPPAMLRRVSMGAILFFVLCMGIFRISTTISYVQSGYIAGVVDNAAYVDAIMPEYRTMYEIINATPPAPGMPNYIYRIGTFIPYYIDMSNSRMYTDDQMDMLSCIRNGRTDEETTAELKRQGFRFIVFDLGIPTIDETPDRTLTKKWESTAEYINSSLHILAIKQDGNNKIVLAEIE